MNYSFYQDIPVKTFNRVHFNIEGKNEVECREKVKKLITEYPDLSCCPDLEISDTEYLSDTDLIDGDIETFESENHNQIL